MIRFTVITAPSTGIPTGFSMLFGPGGGTIGRSHRCTWQLNDIDCLVSRVHAEIITEDSTYRIVDRSTNGLFVNQSDSALGQGQSVSLHHGDSLRVGPYVLQVAMESDRVAAGIGDLGPADFLQSAPLRDGASNMSDFSIADSLSTARPDFAFSASSSHLTQVASRPHSLRVLDPIDSDESSLEFEQQLRQALRPFAGNMVMDFNRRELLALVTYLVGRAKQLNSAAT